MRHIINTGPLKNLWTAHTDDIPVLITGRVHHMDDPRQSVTVVFDADATGFCWHGHDTSTDAVYWPDHPTAAVTANGVLAQSHEEGPLPLSYRTLLDVCAALDELAESWRLRPSPADVGPATPERTGLAMLFLDSTRTLCLLRARSGYVHAGVRNPRTGAIHVDIAPTRTLSRALETRLHRDTAVAHALTDDQNASPEDVHAAGWLSTGHAALAFLHTNCGNPWQYQRLLSQDPVASRILEEGFLSALA